MEWKSLPVDLQEEILSRVPAKSLARLRSTSKQWNALLNMGSFTKNHSANAPKESLVILADYGVYVVRTNLHGIHNVSTAAQFYLKDPFSSFSPVDIGDVVQCDSLLLCTTEDHRLVVWNPCSGETKWIKPRNSYKRTDFFALGYDSRSSCKEYKMLRVDPQNNLINNLCEIFDFTTDAWKVLGQTTGWFFSRSCRIMSVKGSAYWVAQCSMSYNLFLLRFDFSTESFQNISSPQPFPYLCPTLSVVKEEQLCLLGYREEDDGTKSADLHVWVTTTCTGSVVSWSKLLTVQGVQYFRGDIFFHGMSFLADEKNKVVVCCSYGIPNKFLDIMKENKHIQLVIHRRTEESKRVRKTSRWLLMNYFPSLAPIQQGTHFLEDLKGKHQARDL